MKMVIFILAHLEPFFLFDLILFDSFLCFFFGVRLGFRVDVKRNYDSLY